MIHDGGRAIIDALKAASQLAPEYLTRIKRAALQNTYNAGVSLAVSRSIILLDGLPWTR